MPDVAIDVQDPWGFSANDPIGAVLQIRLVPFRIEADPLSVASNPPLVDGVSPPAGTAIRRDQPLALAVQPAPPNQAAAMRRVLLLAHFPLLDLYEVVHDGDGFSTAYPPSLGNARAAVGQGFAFTVLRREGWPASPRLVPVAVDVNGAINAVSSTVYAWTLV